MNNDNGRSVMDLLLDETTEVEIIGDPGCRRLTPKQEKARKERLRLLRMLKARNVRPTSTQEVE